MNFGGQGDPWNYFSDYQKQLVLKLMQEQKVPEKKKQPTFCGVCRHPTDIPPGHELNCPVYTQEPVAGIYAGMIYAGQRQEDMQPMPGLQQAQGGMMGSLSFVCPHCGGLNGMHQWAGEGPCPGVSTHWSQHGSTLMSDGYEVAKIYRDARERLLEELKSQVEINKRLSLELSTLRLELLHLKAAHPSFFT